VVWFDALVSNLDRSARNTNLLRWHGRLWLIDHGAALYFHHDWSRPSRPQDPFTPIREHVLLPCAAPLAEVDAALAGRLSRAALEAVQALPEPWLAGEAAFADAAALRGAYVEHLCARLQAPRAFVQEAERARTQHL